MIGLIKKAIRRVVWLARGGPVRINPQIAVETVRLGSEYGGHAVCPEYLNADSVVYSVGVGEDISFDLAVMNRFHCRILAFDPTPKSIEWLKTQTVPDGFAFEGVGVAAFDGDATFYPPENPSHVSHTMLDKPETAERSIVVPMKRLTTLMKELGHDHIDLLKLDIEGAEYDVIDDIVQSGVRVGQLALEFHHGWSNIGFSRTRRALKTLWDNGFRVVSCSETATDYTLLNTRTHSVKR